MKKIKEFLKLMRVKHYLKNSLIFLPILFSGNFFNTNLLIKCLIGFISFSLVCSIVYIINDLKDISKDKMHEKKKNRPLVKGTISKMEAKVLIFILLVVSIFIMLINKFNMYSIGIVFIYLFINIAYSVKLKEIPIVDVAILTFGFILRVIFGGYIINVEVSSWLYLTVMSMAFYLSLGKRRNEIIKSSSKTRSVLKYYNKEFLDKFMYLCLSLTIVFYSLWTSMSISGHIYEYLVWTVPFVILICMRYSMIIEGNSDGDPVEVVLKDKSLLVLIFLYAVVIISVLYF